MRAFPVGVKGRFLAKGHSILLTGREQVTGLVAIQPGGDVVAVDHERVVLANEEPVLRLQAVEVAADVSFHDQQRHICGRRR